MPRRPGNPRAGRVSTGVLPGATGAPTRRSEPLSRPPPRRLDRRGVGDGCPSPVSHTWVRRAVIAPRRGSTRAGTVVCDCGYEGEPNERCARRRLPLADALADDPPGPRPSRSGLPPSQLLTRTSPSFEWPGKGRLVRSQLLIFWVSDSFFERGERITHRIRTRLQGGAAPDDGGDPGDARSITPSSDAGDATSTGEDLDPTMFHHIDRTTGPSGTFDEGPTSEGDETMAGGWG